MHTVRYGTVLVVENNTRSLTFYLPKWTHCGRLRQILNVVSFKFSIGRPRERWTPKIQCMLESSTTYVLLIKTNVDSYKKNRSTVMNDLITTKKIFSRYRTKLLQCSHGILHVLYMSVAYEAIKIIQIF